VQDISINEKQTSVLKTIVAVGPTPTENYDKRVLGALGRKEFVKVSENKKGSFVRATAKGKKFIN